MCRPPLACARAAFDAFVSRRNTLLHLPADLLSRATTPKARQKPTAQILHKAARGVRFLDSRYRCLSAFIGGSLPSRQVSLAVPLTALHPSSLTRIASDIDPAQCAPPRHYGHRVRFFSPFPSPSSRPGHNSAVNSHALRAHEFSRIRAQFCTKDRLQNLLSLPNNLVNSNKNCHLSKIGFDSQKPAPFVQPRTPAKIESPPPLDACAITDLEHK